MAHPSLIALIVIALLPLTVSARKSSAPPLEVYLTPPYTSLVFGEPAPFAQDQVEIPNLTPGQTVAFYLTREGDVRVAHCSKETAQPVFQPVHELNIAHYAHESLVGARKHHSDIKQFNTTSGFESTKRNVVIKSIHTESRDAVAKSTSQVSAAELSTNLGAEKSSVSAYSEKRDVNLGTQKVQATVSETATIQSAIVSESEDKTVSQDQSEETLLRTQADSLQRGSAASASGQQAELARQLAFNASKRGGISGLLDTNDLNSIWDFEIGFGLLNEFDELNSFEFSDHLLGIFEDASTQFYDLMARWDTLTISDLLNGLASEDIRKEAPEGPPPVVYDVELICSTKSVDRDNKIYFGSLFGMHTELINRGAPIYDVLILNSPPRDAYFFANPEESEGFVTQYRAQDQLIVTRVFHAIESGWTFRSLYAAKARPWEIQKVARK